MKNYNISIEELNELLKAHNEDKIDLSNQELEIIEKIKNNDTSALKFYNIIQNRIIELKNLKKLDKKLDKEYAMFVENTQKKTKEEIISSAYELTVKEELKETLKGMELFPSEVTNLLKQKNILNEFYYDWLNDGTPLGEILEDSIDNSISMVRRYYEEKEKNKERKNKER